MTALADWADSGALALTGRSDGPPLIPPGAAASYVRAQLSRLGVHAPALLSERAAYAGLRRSGPWSCGGRFRVLPTADGHFGISLARATDAELVPALIGRASVDPWADVFEWAAASTTDDAASRAELLGLPGGAVPTQDPGPGVTSRQLGERAPRREPLVVDLTSLWAGPLCAHLLGMTGARIVKIESHTRPDGARGGPPAFFDLLHRGHEQLVLDLPHDLPALRRIIASADLVLESSRPRALLQLGLHAEEFVADGTSWLSITARGRTSNAVGFGDDVAACAGLVVADGSDLLPIGDAVADPLAGVAAAIAAHDALLSEEARLIDVSMLGVAAELRGPQADGRIFLGPDNDWLAEDEHGRYVVREPRRRGCS